jgi:hypothetical protein
MNCRAVRATSSWAAPAGMGFKTHGGETLAEVGYHPDMLERLREKAAINGRIPNASRR